MQAKHSKYQRYGNFIINKSQPLGSGKFGNVYKGYLITPSPTPSPSPHQATPLLQPVAIKQSHNETSNIKQIQTLQILKHRNIIEYKDYRISGSTVFLVMELCEGGTLDDLLYGMQLHDWEFNLERLVGIYGQIVEGIRFMYDKKILHRDIKPSNILVTKFGTIKIADFGTSKLNRSNQIKLKTLVGTPLFFSPQLLQMSFGQQDTYTQKSQIWALGLILYYMFNYQHNIAKPTERMKQSLPWTGRNTAQIFKNIKSQPLVFKKDKEKEIPEEIKDVIRRMLRVDVESRMSFEELFQLDIFKKDKTPKGSTSITPPHPNPNPQKYNTATIYPTPTQSQYIEQQIEQTSQNSTPQKPTNLQQQQCTIVINETKRQTIDWELLELLERRDQELEDGDQREELRGFYEVVIGELGTVVGDMDDYGGQGNAHSLFLNSKLSNPTQLPSTHPQPHPHPEPHPYSEFLFQLQFIYYQLTSKVEQKNQILNKYTMKEHKERFKELDMRFGEGYGNNPSIMSNFSGGGGIGVSGGGEFGGKGGVIGGVLPSEKLINYCKAFIKDNLPALQNLLNPKNKQTPSTSPSQSQTESQLQPTNITTSHQHTRKLAYLIYDLLTLLTIEKSWQMKRKSKVTMLEYKKIRKLAKFETIVGRIGRGLECIKI